MHALYWIINTTGLPLIFKHDGSYDFRDFAHFLSVYEAACEVLKTPRISAA